MAQSLLRTDSEIESIYRRHVETVYRVCFTYMKNQADTEDAVSDAFVRMIKASPVFESEEHEKAWLIRTATNVCKDCLKHWWRRRKELADSELQTDKSETDDTLEAVCCLPEKYKTVVYLYYFEGYNSAEISRMLKKPQSTVRNYLSEARVILKKRLGDNLDEE